MIDNKPSERDEFRFKQFKLTHGRCGMKIGTDGVLLGAWAQLPDGGSTVLDAGAGCGLISLMIAQRYPQARRIVAMEIEAEAAADLRYNIAQSPWSDRVEAAECDFTTFDEEADLIVSNPPFFVNGERSPEASRALARHGGCGLSPLSLIGFAAQRLSAGGCLAMVFPAEQLDDVDTEATMQQLEIRRICQVASTDSKPPVRILAELRRRGHPTAIDRQTLAIRRSADGSYTDQYIALTHDFYLNMP